MTAFFTSARWPALAAVAAIQTLVIGYMVFDRVTLLSSGREIRAAVVPVDPRDIFRGDYVTLSYAFSTGAEIALPEGAKKGDTVYARMKAEGPAAWTLTGVSASAPDVAGDGEAVLKAVVDSVRRGETGSPGTVGRLRYGIERFYVPQGEGLVIEKQVFEKRIVAVLAVGRDGKAALKGLEADGVPIAQEPVL